MPIRRSLVIRLVLTALVLGIGIGAVWNNNFAYWLIGGLGMFVLALSMAARNKIVYLTGILLLVFCFGGIWARLFEPIIDQSHIGFYNGRKIVLQGAIVEEPEMKEASIRYVVGKIKINDSSLRGRLLITAKLYPEYHYGDYLEIECNLKKPEPLEGFAYDKYLARYDIYSQCSFPKIKVLAPDKGNALRSALLNLKHYFIGKLEEIFPATPAALAAGLLIGERSSIPAELKDQFSKTGLSHILAVSGFNIAIIGQAIYWICAYFPFMNRRRAFWLAIGIISCFVLIAGFEASIIRAAIMGILALIAEQIGRKKSGLNLLLIAAAAMLLLNPKLFFWDAGFQLSFLAAFGLLEVAPRIEKYFLWMPDNYGLRETFNATISAQIMTLPIIASSFGMVSLVAPLTNILILPLIPYIMLFVLISGIGAMVFIKLGTALVLIPLIAIWYVISTVQFFSNLPLSSVKVDSIWIIWIGFAVIFCGIFYKDIKLALNKYYGNF